MSHEMGLAAIMLIVLIGGAAAFLSINGGR
jgi:hypothetical protein